MPVWNSAMGRWEGTGTYLSLDRNITSDVCGLTGLERRHYERLVSWWLTWTPPAEPYSLGPGVRVLDPVVSHSLRVERIRENCTGQVQRALYDWLKRHQERFGGDV